MHDPRVVAAQMQIDEEAEQDYRRDIVRDLVVDAIVDGWTRVEIGDRTAETLLEAFGDYVLELAWQLDYNYPEKSKAKYEDAYCLAVWTVRQGDTDDEICEKRKAVALDFVADNFDAWEHLK